MFLNSIRSALYLRVLIFIIPAIGMIAGLSVSVTGTALLFILVFELRENIKYLKSDRYLELCFLGWFLIESCRTINFTASFIQNISVAFIFYVTLLILDNLHFLKLLPQDKAKLGRALASGILTAILIFWLERLSEGVVTGWFRRCVQSNSVHGFIAYMLDRGCALLSVSSWVAMFWLSKANKVLYALLLYITISILLFFSDSDASLLAFLCGGVVFLTCNIFNNISFFYVARFLTISLLALIPLFAYLISPSDLSNKYNKFLSESAKHRLFIWQFTGKKIAENPMLGYGSGSSKYLTVLSDEMIIRDDRLLHPLPLHPHNNILQIALECGLIGLGLGLTLINKWLKSLSGYLRKDKAFAVFGYSCFATYLVIGMISYSVWQLWWVCTGSFTLLTANLLLKNDSL
jgi:O-antigen ligase